MKKPDYKYWRVNDLTRSAMKTVSKSEGSVKCGFYRHGNITELVEAMIKNNIEAFEALGFDATTIKFEISLKKEH